MAWAIALVVMAAAFATLWTIRRPARGLDEIPQAQALDLLSAGFEWAYEEPYLVFRLQDGRTVWWEITHQERWREPVS